MLLTSNCTSNCSGTLGSTGPSNSFLATILNSFSLFITAQRIPTPSATQRFVLAGAAYDQMVRG